MCLTSSGPVGILLCHLTEPVTSHVPSWEHSHGPPQGWSATAPCRPHAARGSAISRPVGGSRYGPGGPTRPTRRTVGRVPSEGRARCIETRRLRAASEGRAVRLAHRDLLRWSSAERGTSEVYRDPAANSTTEISSGGRVPSEGRARCIETRRPTSTTEISSGGRVPSEGRARCIETRRPTRPPRSPPVVECRARDERGVSRPGGLLDQRGVSGARATGPGRSRPSGPRYGRPWRSGRGR